MSKRILVALLAMLMVISMTVPSLAEAITFPLVSAPLTLRFMAPRPSDFANGYEDMKLLKKYEETTGINIEWEEIPIASWNEKIKLVLNSTELPDVIYGGDISSSMGAKYGADGVLLPLNDLIDKNTVNLKRLLAERPDIKKLITSTDGNIYGIPSIDESLSTQVAGVLGMNMTWLGNLNLSIPTTVDEFTSVLRAFRDNDPNKNGQKDEIPLSLRSTDATNRTTWIGSMFGMFGVVDDSTHIMIKDGKVIFAPEQEGFRKALEYFHSLYTEGLLDPESFTQDDSQFFAKARSAEGIGASYVFSTFDLDENNNEFNNYDLIDPIKGADGNALVNLASYISGVSQNRFCITADCKDPVAAIKWIDYWCDNGENALTIRFGYEGDSWKWLDDTKANFTEMATAPNGDKVNQAYVSQNTPYTRAVMWELQDLWRKKKNSAPYFIERAKFANGSYRSVAVKEMWPMISFDEETTERFNEINTDLRSYVENTMCTFIINGFDDAQWEEFVNKCHTLNSEELCQIYQVRYDQFMAS